MKKKKFVSALALTLALLCAFTLGANASGTLQEIKAYLNAGITVKLDGTEQILKDANGTRIFPITYNGSTYLPVRAVSNMLGIGVDWDQATQSVLLGKQASGVDLIDTYDNYLIESGPDSWIEQNKTSGNKTTAISGIDCSNWITFYMGYNNRWVTTKIYFNLDGKYDNLTFQYYSDKDVTLKVLGDNDSVLFEQEILGGKVAQTVTVPLLKTNQLSFYVERASGVEGSHTSIFNAYLDAEQ